MVTRQTGYIFVHASPLTKAGGADEVDGNDWTRIVKHSTQVVSCANETVTMQITDYIFECTTSAGSVEIDLTAAASSTGKEIWVHKNSGSNSVVLDPDGAELINGGASLTLSDDDSWVHAFCDGTAWHAQEVSGGAGDGDEYTEVYEGGVVVGSQPRHLNFDASDFSLTEDSGNDWVTVALAYGTSAGTPAEGNHTHAIQALTNTSGATGDVFYYTAGGLIARLAAGTEGQVLKMGASVPEWGTDETGGGGGGTAWTVTSVSASATASWLHAVRVTTGSTDRTITLTTASGNSGSRVLIKKVDSGSGSVIIDGSGAQTIDGSGQIVLTNQYETVVLYSNGTNVEIENWF